MLRILVLNFLIKFDPMIKFDQKLGELRIMIKY
jgi:hypothetical protein